MAQNEPQERLIRFGVFELNPESGELRKSGVRMKLSEQPFRILRYLAGRPGELVTRDELQRLLWGEDTFVDFEHGLNASINKLRETLGDSASNPLYIETVPRRGYRFVGELAPTLVPRPDESGIPVTSKKRHIWWWPGIVAMVSLATAGGAWWGRSRSPATPPLTMRALTADAGLTTHPVLPRDGKLVAYASDRATSKNLDIWVHPLTEGAQPIRVTKHEADDLLPDFSPDGGLITFRSERDGGGIYVVPTLGGEERLLVRGANYPRFSPDGKSIAYYVGGHELIKSRIYVIPVAGGTPRELAADVPWASSPVFSSNGRHVLFEGASGPGDIGSHDWWVTPVAGGSSVKTGAFAILSRQMKIENIFKLPLMDLSEGRCIFAFQSRVWQLDLTAPDWKAKGPAHPLTSGSTVSFARAGADGRMVFANSHVLTHLWKLTMDLNTGKTVGEIEPLPHSGGSQFYPSSSADGQLLAYTQEEPAGYSIRLRDLATAKESTLVNVRGRPKVSPDGSQVAYSVLPNSIYVMPAAGGESSQLNSPEQKADSEIRGWTADGKRILYWWFGKPVHWALLDPQTRASIDLIVHPTLVIYTLEMSPDQRWVAFTTQAGTQWNLWIAACRDGKVVGEKDWILVNTGRDERPWWSPDGNLLYTVSQRDGTRCIWAHPLNPSTKQPKGEPFAVHHFHRTRVKVGTGLLPGFGPAILPDGLIFSLHDLIANVWIAEPQK